ncbi:MAG: redox-regulated ATPase YchF [Deltaproteobacteria bacterium]|nr:redox-regulated ATPase YchF [Deltaproteobacteria bacterium]
MALSIGIVGLPNVGKSTLFNALTQAQNAASANYPFCTIEPNLAVVPVPDHRLEALAKLVDPAKITPATVDFIDIAGLVKGASQGEGLGNKFLANIRDTQAILHVVRCFDDPDVIHVDGSVNPIRDIEVVETELILADAQTLERRVERMGKQIKGDKSLQPMLDLASALLARLMTGQPARGFSDLETDHGRAFVAETSLLTLKPVIYCANVDDASLGQGNQYVDQVREFAASRGEAVVTISARMEEELVGLDPSERADFLESFGVSESGLAQIIHTGYATLGLISYFTAGPKEVRAWTIRRGWKAPKAASVIHTDFEKGFIRAEIVGFDDYVAQGSESACRAAGLLRSEGKEYVVRDGDVVHFLFNV